MFEKELRFVVYREDCIDDELDKKIRTNLCICFPHSAWYFKHSRGWKGSFPHWSVVVLDSSDDPVAHCGVIERTITIANTSYVIFGIQNVYVVEALRNLGIAKTLLQKVEEEAFQQELDFGLLFCRPHVAKLYTDLGWVAVPETSIWVTTENGEKSRREFKHDLLYFKPIRLQELPQGSIYFNGPDW
ncbi:MAG: GNAT family N-acetyltransferase [Sphaerochaetaceae bacterium]|nr:GNAT family N-acetyltransferase [Sphaerochaetaceae bacterium]MDY0370811.1 GNAT family N-acetyltransferase [Sphaerochaetaceae bacterium]